MRKLSPVKKLTMGAMVCALSLLFLYTACVLPTMRLACYFLSAVFVYALAYEGAYVFSIIAFMATAALAFFLLPEKTPLIPYITLLGHYGIFKRAVDMHIPMRLGRFLAKLLYCNAFTAIGVFVMLEVLGLDLFAMLPAFPIWALILIAEAAFIVFEILFIVVARFYEARIRNLILPRR